MNPIFDIFTAWEDILKARKPIGLDKWAKLSSLSEKLKGKHVDAISFTCAHPSHNGEPVKHLLGSVEGNLHFLLGYGNPRFHLAAYHMQVLDPNLTEEEAEEMFSRFNNPANPALWSKAGLVVGDEGDASEGTPHSAVRPVKEKETKDKNRKQEEIPLKSPTGKYVAYPSEGLIYGEHNNQFYKWELVKDTFIAALNPNLLQDMDSSVLKSAKAVSYKKQAPDLVKAIALKYRGMDFSVNVWPLIKSRVPSPGQILYMEGDQAESIYGVVTPTSIEFYLKDASKAHLVAFDKSYAFFDITKNSNTPPSVLFSFISKNFNVDRHFLQEVSTHSNELRKSEAE